ncbi:DUF6183 family protein [Streptomyces sp. NBC_01508]|uniref:DUF6183 family protein n=1 Tax=Streptomyces sp. NBC_01508 TaxID=2903888 RepID=UPI003868E69B
MGDDMDDLGRLVRGQAQQRAAQGDVAFVRELGVRLAERNAAAREQVRESDRQLALVMRILALTPGRDSLEQLLQLLDDEHTTGAGLPQPFIASLLAEHQRAADLTAAVLARRDRYRVDELRACLFHELLIRGVDVDAFQGRDVYAWLYGRIGPHRFTWLPARRRELEAGAGFPRRRINGSAFGTATGVPAEGRADPPTPRTTERSALRDVATNDVFEAIVAAVREGGWGYCEAWVFRPDEPVAPDRVPALLPTLPMPCVDGLGPTGRFEVAVRPVDEIWRLLFGVASMGGMWGKGAHGAYGRLWAWKSMAGLCGAPEGASAEEVETLARLTTWFHFEADAEWFHNDIDSDFGVAALSPDGRRIAVLAATDTD